MERRHKVAALIGGIIVPIVYLASAYLVDGVVKNIGPFLTVSGVFFPLGVPASFVGGRIF